MLMQRPTHLLLGTSLLFLLASAASSQVATDCLTAASYDISDPSNPCTANDIAIKEVIVNSVIDGCVNSTDTGTISMDALIEVSGGGTKYDVSIFLHLEGGEAFSDDSLCYRDYVDPFPFDENDNPLTAQGIDGDGDACGDVTGNVTEFLGPITVSCSDFADLNTAADGIVDFSGCVGYVQNANGIICGDNSLDINSPAYGPPNDSIFYNGPPPGGGNPAPNDYCGGMDPQFCAYPITKSKCGCSRQPACSIDPVTGECEPPNILYAPELTLTKSCTPTIFGQGVLTSDCTITFENLSNVAPADFIGFIDAIPDELILNAASIMVDGGLPVLNEITLGGTPGNNQTITWAPDGDVGTANIAPGATSTLTYEVTIADPNTPAVFENTVCAADFRNGLMDPVTQTALCSSQRFDVAPTAVMIAESSSRPTPQGNRVAWTTAAEAGTISLQLQRWDDLAQTWRSVGAPISTLREAPQGADYEVLDPDGDENSRYRVVETEISGDLHPHVLEPSAKPTRIARRSVNRTAAMVDRPVRVARQSERRARADLTIAAKKQAPSGGSDRVVVEVLETGVQTVSVGVLADLFGEKTQNVSSDIRSGKLMVQRDGQEVAWWSGDSAQSIHFFATAEDDLHSPYTAYWVDRASGVEADSVRARSTGSPVTAVDTTTRLEENRIPNLVLLNSVGDFWFWDVAGVNGTADIDFEAPHVTAGSDAEISVEFLAWRVGSGAEVDATLNGTPIGTQTVDEEGWTRATFFAPAGTLQSGSNALQLRNNAQLRASGLDAVTVSYLRALVVDNGHLEFDLDDDTSVAIDGLNPSGTQLVQIVDGGTGATLYDRLDHSSGLLTADLSAGRYVAYDQAFTPSARAYEAPLVPDQAAPADMAIVTHPTLMAAAETYAEYRRDQGHRVVVKSTTELYDLYSGSMPSPDAIRRFAQATDESSGGELEALFLIGTGTFDHRDLTGFGRSLVPTAFLASPGGIASSDRLLVDFDGDRIDDAAVGRLPAETSEQVLAYLDRVRAYEGGTGNWQDQDIVLSDNPDNSGNFYSDSDALLPELRNPLKIYLGQTHTRTTARDALFDAWSDSRLVQYFGHGGVQTVAHEGLMTSADLPSLESGPTHPLFVALTCHVGRFDIPQFVGLGESLLLSDQGAVAVWSSSWLSDQADVAKISKEFYDALEFNRGLRLGAATKRALWKTGPQGSGSNLVLLGDPMLTIP